MKILNFEIQREPMAKSIAISSSTILGGFKMGQQSEHWPKIILNKLFWGTEKYYEQT